MRDDFEAQKAENIHKLGERQDLIDQPHRVVGGQGLVEGRLEHHHLLSAARRPIPSFHHHLVTRTVAAFQHILFA